MSEREVSKSQQTFTGVEAASFSFAFYKVYKRQAKNRFRVRVVSLADYGPGSPKQHVYSASGMNVTGTLSGVTPADGIGMLTNDFTLGITPRDNYDTTTYTTVGGVIYAYPVEFYTDEVSTSPFTVKYRHIDSTTYATGSVSLVIVFEITELEYVE
jgi:hypothetical protein